MQFSHIPIDLLNKSRRVHIYSDDESYLNIFNNNNTIVTNDEDVLLKAISPRKYPRANLLTIVIHAKKHSTIDSHVFNKLYTNCSCYNIRVILMTTCCPTNLIKGQTDLIIVPADYTLPNDYPSFNYLKQDIENIDFTRIIDNHSSSEKKKEILYWYFE